MMTYAYYPGCCLNTTCKDFDTSMRVTLRALDIEVEDIKRWICCGSSAVHVASRYLAVALPMDNLAKAERQGFEDVMVPCAACYARFKFAMRDVQQDSGLRHEVEEALKHRFNEKLRIVHPLELFQTEEMVRRITAARKRDLSALKVVCYYGCFLSRIPDHFDDVERPRSMDIAMQAAGVQVLDWPRRTDCCGGNFSLTRTDIAHKLSHDILDSAREAGAEAIVVACPFCHMNLDARQNEVEIKYSTSYGIPVYYYSQILAAALGAPERDLMLQLHFVNPKKVIEKAGIYGK